MLSPDTVRRHTGDAALVVLTVATLIEIAVSDLPQPKLPFAAVALAWTLPLFLRNRFHFLAPLATTTVFAIGSFFVADNQRAVAIPILTAISAGWVMGIGNERRRAVVGLAAMYVGVQITTAHFSDVQVGDVVFTSLLVAAPWFAGQLVRNRADHVAELRNRAAQLEAERNASTERALVEERTRIARELHDVVAHSISVMTIQAGAARLLLDEDPDRAEEPLRRVEDTGRETLGEMRRLLGLLRRDMTHDQLEPRPTLEHIDVLVAQYRGAGLPVELEIAGVPRSLPAGLDLAAYRIVQEALTNTLKHAESAHAVITVTYAPGSLTLSVVDDGQLAKGANRRGGGHGLVGMRERAAIYGAQLEAAACQGGGFAVSVVFPLERAAT